MNALEERLRCDLPALADVLVDAGPAAPQSTSEAGTRDGDLQFVDPSGAAGRRRRSGVAVVLAGAAVAFAVVAGLVVIAGRDDPTGDPAASSAPAGFGTWSAMAEGPIEPRPHAVTAWTGDEVVFWAGSSLSRGFAYADGAVYDPNSDTWRAMREPGWGHPGLVSAFVDGAIYASAKGGVSRIDPANDEWTDVARLPDGSFLTGLVAAGDSLWGLGPLYGTDAALPTSVVAARYDASIDSWTLSSPFGADAEVVAALTDLDAEVVWTGDEIVVWAGDRGGVAFDPGAYTWRTIDPPLPSAGHVVDSHAVMSDAGLVVVAVVDVDDSLTVQLARPGADGWEWTHTALTVTSAEGLTAAPAGEWIVLFEAHDEPVTIHVPSGAWLRHHDGPLGGVEAPNTAWTGEQLVVWGGVPDRTGVRGPDVTDGAVWTPPA